MNSGLSANEESPIKGTISLDDSIPSLSSIPIKGIALYVGMTVPDGSIAVHGHCVDYSADGMSSAGSAKGRSSESASSSQLVLLQAQAGLADSVAQLCESELRLQKAKVDAARIRLEIATTTAASSRSKRSRSDRLNLREPPAPPPKGDAERSPDLSITGLRDVHDDLSSLMGRDLLESVCEELVEDNNAKLNAVNLQQHVEELELQSLSLIHI